MRKNQPVLFGVCVCSLIKPPCCLMRFHMCKDETTLTFSGFWKMQFIASLVWHIISNTPSITLSKSLQENHIVFHSCQEIGPATYPLYSYINQASESSCCHMHSHLFPIFFNITLSINSSHMSHVPPFWLDVPHISPCVFPLCLTDSHSLHKMSSIFFKTLHICWFSHGFAMVFPYFPTFLEWFTNVFLSDLLFRLSDFKASLVRCEVLTFCKAVEALQGADGKLAGWWLVVVTGTFFPGLIYGSSMVHLWFIMVNKT